MRWIGAAVVIGIWVLLMLVGEHRSPPERAKLTFIAISVVCLGFVMLAGVFQTADCLSEERREGTLGLLFLTDLKGHEVVFGKLASTSLHSFYSFLAIVPVLALPLLMGGMTVGEFWRVTLVLVVTLYLSLSVGMFISALCQDTRSAMVGTFFVMLVLAGLLPVFWWLAALNGSARGWNFLLWPNPPHAYQVAFDMYHTTSKGAREFWTCILTMLGIGTTGLVAASLMLPRLWQESGSRAGKAKSKRDSLLATRSKFDYVSRALRSARPFLWLVMRDRRPRKLAFWAFAILLPIWFCFYISMWSRNGMSQGLGFSVAMFMAFGMHQVLKCLLAAEASRRLSADRQSGALELLLVTPLATRDIVSSQISGLWRTFRWGFLALALVNLALLWFALASDMFQHNSEGRSSFTLVMLGGVVMLALDAVALMRVGMWAALTKKRHARAFLATVKRVLLPSWLAVLFFIFLGFAGALNGGPGMFETVMILWFIFGGVVAVVAARVARNSLEDHFREVVALGDLESKLSGSGKP
jgi:ABC-type transport system involved in cytochrome c biogenesis permease component